MNECGGSLDTLSSISSKERSLSQVKFTRWVNGSNARWNAAAQYRSSAEAPITTEGQVPEERGARGLLDVERGDRPVDRRVRAEVDVTR